MRRIAAALLVAFAILAAVTIVTLALRPHFVTAVLVNLGLASAPGPPPILTLEERLALISPGATARLAAYFAAVQIPYPPQAVALVGIKASKTLQLYARSTKPDAPWKLVHAYPIRAASGHLGPKLKEGDRQVPEGVYGIDSLNPNSKFSVSMRVSYPNATDRANAAKDKRDKDRLGGDIMIHGRASSIGCLAMGDPAAEELFVLAHTVGLANVTVILAPVDLRTEPRPLLEHAPAWLADVYAQIEAALKPLPLPSGSAS